MDYLDRLVDEVQNKCWDLAMLYHHFMAGDCPRDRLRWEYMHGLAVKSLIDKIDKKYAPIVEDMGFHYDKENKRWYV